MASLCDLPSPHLQPRGNLGEPVNAILEAPFSGEILVSHHAPSPIVHPGPGRNLWSLAQNAHNSSLPLSRAHYPQHLPGHQTASPPVHFLEVTVAFKALFCPQVQGIICFRLHPGLSLGPAQDTWSCHLGSHWSCYQEPRINMLLLFY